MNKKPHLSTVEIANLNTICEENGIASLIRFAAQKVAHEALDGPAGIDIRIELNKIALKVDQMRSRFDDDTI